MPICSNCNQDKPSEKGDIIDEKFYCFDCLYDGHLSFPIFPIGYVENDLTRGKGFGIKGNRLNSSKINLLKSQEPFLHKLKDEKHLTIVFYLHDKQPVKSTFRRGIDRKKVGVFASRTPNRCSRIGISEVKLVKIEGLTLYVKGFDAINGTPVIDIKLGYQAMHR